MLSLLEYMVLSACADDVELFYFPFAQANYGGQAFRCAEALVYPGDEEDSPLTLAVDPEQVLDAIDSLARAGLLQVWRLPPDYSGATGTRQLVNALAPEDRDAYAGYDCATFEDHLDRFGYGPHELEATGQGLAELSRPDYHGYRKQLGWE